jgi:hypothetical protein
MMRARSKLALLTGLLKSGQLATMATILRRRVYSNVVSFCLRRDLAQPFEAPSAKIAIDVHPITEAEAATLFNGALPGLSAEEINNRIARMGLFRSGIRQCYVATDQNGRPCYAQWLMSSRDNDRIQQFFRSSFPILAPDEALLEGAFTPASHRGQGIMARAMALIAEKAESLGARYVITFVGQNNISSLKGCQRSGFAPCVLRKTEWRLLRSRVRFVPLSEATSYPLDREKEVPRTA